MGPDGAASGVQYTGDPNMTRSPTRGYRPSPPTRPVKRDLHIVARLDGLDRRQNWSRIGSDGRPDVGAQYDQGKFATGEVLLIADIAVRRAEDVEPIGLCRGDQVRLVRARFTRIAAS